MTLAQCRVLALIDTIAVSGPGRQLALSCRHLRSLGVDVRLALFRRPAFSPRPFESFLDAEGIHYSVIAERRAFDIRVVMQLRQIIKEYQPTILQTHSYKASVAAVGIRLAGLRLPWLAFYHGRTAENLKVRGYHAVDRFLIRRADAVVVMAASQADELGRCRVPVEVVHNAILDSPAPTDGVIGDLDASPTLLCVGRLSQEKGVDVLLEALPLVAPTYPGLKLIVVGDGPERQALERQSHALGLGDRVTFAGFQPDPKLYYRTASVLIIPSRSEGLPNVLLEAVAAGLPVVSTRVGAVADVLIDPKAGLLCPVEDPVALANSIRQALTPRFREEGREARRTLLRQFSIERRSEHLLRIYRRLLGHEVSSAA